MLFNEFLETTLTGGLTPTDKLKQDLSTFKTVFNYATKTDVLYNNLIDNIVHLLKIKFGSYQIIYNSVDVMYRELLITLNPQIPQFLMIQKKQLIENLNTFGDLSNWGDILKDNVSRELNLQERGENSSGYVPIDGNNKDPYSTNDISKNNITNENTDVSRLATDYLNFYAKLTWSVADIELNYIYESYIHLFKIYYDFNDSVSGTSGNDSLEYELDKINAAISVLGNELDVTNTNVSTNTTKISELSNLKADKTQLSNYYTKTQSDSRYYTKQDSDGKYAFKGDISNLQGQINNTNNNVATNTRNITTMNSTLQTNSTNIVNLQNVKADKTQLNDYYTKSESDNRYELKGDIIHMSFLNIMFPINSIVISLDGSTHSLVTQFPNSFQEITDKDIAYLAIGTNTSNTNSRSVTIQRNQLPNINLSHRHTTYYQWRQNIRPWNFGSGGQVWDGEQQMPENSGYADIYLNGNVTQQPINFDVKPKTLKIRVWKVIRNLV